MRDDELHKSGDTLTPAIRGGAGMRLGEGSRERETRAEDNKESRDG